MTNTDILQKLRALLLFAAADPALLQKALEGKQAHLVMLPAEKAPPARFCEMLGVVLEGKLQILSADAQRTVVLKNATMPATLLEMGFISNANDAAMLAENPQLFAQGIYNGILSYFQLPSLT